MSKKRLENIIMKTFYGDFKKFLYKVINSEPFSLSRWGDGELSILEDKKIDLREKGNGEFLYDGSIEKYRKIRENLMQSYTYKDDNYYIGIACPCCVGQEKYEYMKYLSTQAEKNLTWANIFVNSNYPRFIDEFIPEFNNHEMNIVINKNSDITNLPFPCKNIWYVGTDAYVENYPLIKKISDYITINSINNEIFLFAAGPFANILTHKLWLVSNKNIYIDIGSVLDNFLHLKLTRGYLLGAKTLNKTCIW